MEHVVDFHLHSKYSRAVSKHMNLPVMAKYAKEKGVQVLTAGDFTHPAWLEEIKSQLVEKSQGIYKLNNSPEFVGFEEISFILSTEISSIYKQDGRLRRIHNLIFFPDFNCVDRFVLELNNRGCNLRADGRPIVGLSSHDLLELALSVSEKTMLIPCHVWTPHFGVYGSASGFEALGQAFGDLEPYVYGIETGISSDPYMNWQIPDLRDKSILSFSDAHSPAKMGREATVLNLENLTYDNIVSALNKKSVDHNKNNVSYTIEYYPEEGKYHNSGHRNCKVSMGPDQIRELGNICPVCKKRLTEGVFYRLQELAGNKEFSKDVTKTDQDVTWHIDPIDHNPSFVKLVPLLELIAKANKSTVASKKVQLVYDELIKRIGNELDILMKLPLLDIERVGGKNVSSAVLKMRQENLLIEPGYDGEYGKVILLDEDSGNKPQLTIDF